MPPDPQALLAEIEALQAEVSSLKIKNILLQGLLSSIRTISGSGASMGAEVAVAQEEEEEEDESSSDDEVEVIEPDSPPQPPVDNDLTSSEDTSDDSSSEEDDDDDDEDDPAVLSVTNAADDDLEDDSDSEDSSSDDSEDDDASDMEVDFVLSRRAPESEESDELDSSDDDDDETPSPNSARRPPPPPLDLDIFPNEILNEILQHLHQPFHFSNYRNALLGINDPPPESEPWNPVGLQRVSRRFKAIAQPLFYHQVALMTGGNVEAIADLLYDLADSPGRFNPFRHTKSLIWIASPSRGRFDVVDLLDSRVVSDLKDLVVKDSHFFALHGVKRTLVLAQDSSMMEDLGLEGVFVWTGTLWRSRPNRPLTSWPRLLDPNHRLHLRLQPLILPIQLTTIVDGLLNLPYLPHFQLDLPFDLTETVFATLVPSLPSLLQHPSLPAGRDFIFEHAGTVKTITFGVKSRRAKIALRKRIEELGALEVVVKVFVLERLD